MSYFYNPYHFVPVEKPGVPQTSRSVKRTDWPDSRPEHVTHERYVPGSRSGRIVVRLTTVTPTVVGAAQLRPNAKEYATVQPYRVDGCPAVPASTLRGLVSAVMEAASNGPLRVLDDRSYSFRKKMEESLSAIGMIVADGESLKLKPMCLPTLESRDGGNTFPVAPKFRAIFPRPQFKVFVGNGSEIRKITFPHRTTIDPGKPVAMKVKQLQWNGNSVGFDASLRVKVNRFAIAQTADQRDSARSGMLRVLGCWGPGRESIPGTKKHELWLPLPDKDAKALTISETALQRFYQLADERTDVDGTLPFEPKETRPDGDRGKGEYFRLRPGDLVYFDVDEKSIVTEISLSAIWRGRVEDKRTRAAARSHDFFKALDEELLPLSNQRQTISFVEQILGFAEDRSGEKSNGPDEDPALSMASRIRFADALLARDLTDAEVLMPAVKLQILSSPKTPSPSLYFTASAGSEKYIAKRSLDPAQHKPHGRKWYLHFKSKGGEQPWATRKPEESKDQKNIVQPMQPGSQLYFHIDYYNLTLEELGLLAYALEPNPTFHHKLGMGKPLGLGSVKLEILGCFEIDRQRRYTAAGLKAERYTSAGFTTQGESIRGSNEWPGRYAEEGDASHTPGDALVKAVEAIGRSGLISKSIHKALTILGDYNKAPLAQVIHYPTNADQADKEGEHFKWFVFNDGQRVERRGMTPRDQYLRSLATQQSLPTLTEMEWEKPAQPRR